MEIKFLFPIDGDVLTPDDGQLITEPLYGERLWIPVRLRVSGIINQQDVPDYLGQELKMLNKRLEKLEKESA